jgi:hypothetical protein
MKAITLRHPWPWAVCRLGKRIENRHWRPHGLPIGEWSAIHGGAPPKNLDGLDDVRCEARGLISRFGHQLTPPLTLRDAILPGIVAVYRFGGVLTESDDPWFEGPIGWKLDDLIVLPEAVPCRGAQGLWPVPEDVLAEVRRQSKQARAE